jgi:hypothetical protein
VSNQTHPYGYYRRIDKKYLIANHSLYKSQQIITAIFSLSVNMFEIQCSERWQVYRRLQELDIPCHCASYKPLKAEIKGAIAASQIWSVTRQFTASRQELINWMEDCWKCKRRRC